MDIRLGKARVKHLNPRQGITTETVPSRIKRRFICVQCETPKSPPGDYNLDCAPDRETLEQLSVKHLNPRQGITTALRLELLDDIHVCETPKSPPGDYNVECDRSQHRHPRHARV